MKYLTKLLYYKFIIKKPDILETRDYIILNYSGSCGDCYTSGISVALKLMMHIITKKIDLLNQINPIDGQSLEE